ncbi:MAG: hypothetical protein QOJ51_4724 [Acidobacteriaceae bacterium]|nr:hypothetical protein [Acidobacteriaceae bacterium]
MIVEVCSGDEGVGLQDEVDGFLLAFRVFDGGVDRIGGEYDTVNSDDLRSGGEVRLVSGASPADVGEDAFTRDAQADRVPEVDPATRPAACAGNGALGGVGLVGVHEFVAAAPDAVEIGMRIDVVDALADEGGPVVLDDLVEVGDELVAVIGDDERAGVTAFGQEDVQEVGEALLIVGLLADESVGVEPEELSLLVVVLATTPVGPCGVASAEDAGGDGGVFGRTPVAAGLVIEVSSGHGEDVAILCLRLEAGARSEDVAEVLRHALINPEE